MTIQDPQIRIEASDHLRIPLSEPVAAIGHPPAKDADGNGGQERPEDGQREIRDQPQRDEDGPEDLALHSFILARAIVLWVRVTELISRRNRLPRKIR